MSAELRELWVLRSDVSALRWRAGILSPAAAELLKAAERVLAEEAVVVYEIAMAQNNYASGL